MTAEATSTRAKWMVLIAAFLGWMFDGMEMGIFPLVARPALLDLLENSGGNESQIGLWRGRIDAFFLIGAAVGGLVFGWLGDKIGRVRAMSVSILFYSLFTGLGYFATAPWHLGLFRSMAALGMGGEWALGVALVMEVWPEKHRPLLAGAIGAASNVGFALIAVISILYPITPQAWRWVMLVGAAPALLIFFIRLFVPESERWKKAVQQRRSKPLQEILSPPLLSRTLMGIAFASVALLVTWGAVQSIPAWADSMAGPDQPKAKSLAQLCSASGAVVGCLAGAWIAGRFGRRITYFGLCGLSLMVGSFLFRSFDSFSGQFLTAVFFMGTCSAAFYGWMPLYLPEIFPTRVRATGQGLSYNFGRIFAALGTWQSGSLMAAFDDSYAKAGATFVLIYIVGMILIWFAPETKGKPLPE